jgi:hypothetical protein
MASTFLVSLEDTLVAFCDEIIELIIAEPFFDALYTPTKHGPLNLPKHLRINHMCHALFRHVLKDTSPCLSVDDTNRKYVMQATGCFITHLVSKVLTVVMHKHPVNVFAYEFHANTSYESVAYAVKPEGSYNILKMTAKVNRSSHTVVAVGNTVLDVSAVIVGNSGRRCITVFQKNQERVHPESTGKYTMPLSETRYPDELRSMTLLELIKELDKSCKWTSSSNTSISPSTQFIEAVTTACKRLGSELSLVHLSTRRVGAGTMNAQLLAEYAEHLCVQYSKRGRKLLKTRNRRFYMMGKSQHVACCIAKMLQPLVNVSVSVRQIIFEHNETLELIARDCSGKTKCHTVRAPGHGPLRHVHSPLKRNHEKRDGAPGIIHTVVVFGDLILDPLAALLGNNGVDKMLVFKKGKQCLHPEGTGLYAKYLLHETERLNEALSTHELWYMPYVSENFCADAGFELS